jgi:hypothetical protein
MFSKNINVGQIRDVLRFKIDIKGGVKFELGCATPIVEGKFINVPGWSEHCRLV